VKKTAVLFTVLVFWLVIAKVGFAQQDHGSSLDAFFGLASEPAGDVGTGLGFGVGLNIPFTSVFDVSTRSDTTDNLVLRADLSYFSWDGDTSAPFVTFEEEFKRIPIFLGLRLFVPPGKIKAKRLGIYGEIGIELSFDEVEVKTTNTLAGTSVKTSDDEINFGVPIGAGIQYYISEKWYLGFYSRLHIISDSYFTLTGAVGFDL